MVTDPALADATLADPALTDVTPIDPPPTPAPILVAEFTTNHLGNLNLLFRMVDAAAKAGCHYIKMQKKDIDSFYTPEKLAAPYESPYGHTYRDYRQTFEFGFEDFVRFDEQCRAAGTRWFATAQDVPSLEFLLQFDLPLLKVASCNARNLPFLKEVAVQASEMLPLVISLAGSELSEIDRVVELFAGRRLWLLHCVAEYPCEPSRLRLGNITELRKRYAGPDISIGYSGHEVGIVPSAVAMELGAAMIERHFCLSRHSFAHHIECSLEPDEFSTLAHMARFPQKRRQVAADIDPQALASGFGMTMLERSFLEAQTYGRDHLGTRSGFHG